MKGSFFLLAVLCGMEMDGACAFAAAPAAFLARPAQLGARDVATNRGIVCSSPRSCCRISSMRMGRKDKAPVSGNNVVPPLTSTAPRRIGLFIEPTPFTHVSGYANRFRELLKFLKKAGDDVHIVTTDDKADAPTEFLGFPITTTSGFRFSLYKHIVLSFDTDLKGWAFMERVRPDVLHVTSPGFIVFAALMYARVFRVPLVFSYHTHLPRYARSYVPWMPLAEEMSFRLLKFVHNRADLTLVTSPQMRDELEAAGIQRVDVWRKGIDTERFHPRHRSAEMRSVLCGGAANTDAPLLVYIGRLGSEKRLRDLRRVLEKVPGARLALVGTGPDEDALKAHFRGTRTVFTGVMTGEALSQAFASADVFVMPSDSETLGFVVLESMASGVPVVAAKAGGIPDLIRDGETGYLVPPGDANAFAARVKALLADQALRKTMSEAGREETEKWSWEAATSYLRNVQYRRAVTNFKYRAFNGLGLPRTRSRWRAILIGMRRRIFGSRTDVTA